LVGEATIASDDFKTFVSGLKNLFGGNIPEFEPHHGGQPSRSHRDFVVLRPS
jgi:hypothetical protein